MRRITYCLLCVFLISILIIACSYSERNKKSGESIVQLIEKYKKDNDTLPNSLHEMGIDDMIDDVLFCYEKVDSANYIVWFGTTLGEGIYYYSDTKKWENRLRGIKN